MSLARDITHADLVSALLYDPSAGHFVWVSTSGRGVRPGDRAGTGREGGYRRIQLHGRVYQEHRLAVLYMTGSWPDEEVDHVNGRRDDNRWENLRCVSKAGNMQNKRRAHAGNVSGLMGACYNKRNNRFIAKAGVDGVDHYLGTYKTAVEAHHAYCNFKRSRDPSWAPIYSTNHESKIPGEAACH